MQAPSSKSVEPRLPWKTHRSPPAPRGGCGSSRPTGAFKPSSFEKACVWLLVALLASCSAERERADLVFINGAEPESVDPAVVTDQASMRISASLFEGLCRVNVEGKSEPAVAERWDISADKKEYTFHLRSGLTWSNGEAVTATDFVRSWQRVLEPKTGADYASQLYVIKNARAYNEGAITDFTQVGVRTVDDRTLRVTLENPTPYFLDLCAFITFAPVNLPTLEQHGSAWIKPEHLVGNGAYTLEEWLLDDRIVLKKNPRYWDAANVRMRSVEIMPVSDPNTALNYFLTGQVDLMMDKGTVPVSLVSRLKKEPWFHTGPFLGTWFIRFNVTKPPFDNPLVRQAFSLAIDKRRITEKITNLGERTAGAIVPPGAGQDYQPPLGLDYDPAKARELLARAGFPEGKGFPLVEYLYIPLLVERNIAVELQAMWQQNLGVTVNLAKQEQKNWLASMRTLGYQMTRSSWVGDYNDPNTFLEMFTSASGNNRTGWKSAAYDELIAAAAREPNVARRNAIFQDAERQLISAESVILPVYYYVGVQFYHAERLGGVQPNLIDDHPFRCMYWK
jgi:oligopeptide transport system substrate-binding protein